MGTGSPDNCHLLLNVRCIDERSGEGGRSSAVYNSHGLVLDNFTDSSSETGPAIAARALASFNSISSSAARLG